MPYSHDYDKILTRLVTILSRLNDGEALSTKELAEEFNTDVRTVQRDFRRLVGLFPIYQEKRKWKMREGWRLEKNRSVKEHIVLAVLDNMTESIGGTFAVTAHALLNRLKNDDVKFIYTKLNIEDIGDRFTDMQHLERAIKNRLEITCHYDSERQGPQNLTLKPLKIANYEGFWYLLAWDEDEDVRKCYLKNVSNINVTDVTFEGDANIEKLLDNSLSVWFQVCNEPFDVTIHASPTAATYFKRRPLPTQKIGSVHQDGSIEFTVTITYEMEIIPIIKYWIPHLRVLEPEWLQGQVDEELTTYLNSK